MAESSSIENLLEDLREIIDYTKDYNIVNASAFFGLLVETGYSFPDPSKNISKDHNYYEIVSDRENRCIRLYRGGKLHFSVALPPEGIIGDLKIKMHYLDWRDKITNGYREFDRWKPPSPNEVLIDKNCTMGDVFDLIPAFKLIFNQILNPLS